MGDSITEGVGDETNQGGFRGPLYALNSRLQPVGLNTDPVGLAPKEHHQGTGGITTTTTLANLAAYLAAAPNVDVATVHLGTNDVALLDSESASNNVSIVQQILAARPSARVLVAGIIGTDGDPQHFASRRAALLAALQAAFTTDLYRMDIGGGYTGQHVVWVPMPDIPAGAANWAPSPPSNGLHPNHNGYATYMAPAWAAAMARVGLGP